MALRIKREDCYWEALQRQDLLHCLWELKQCSHCVKQYAAAKSFQSCPTLCDPIGGSPPGSPIPGILQARTVEWVAISFSSAWKWNSESEVAQSCPTFKDPMDCSPPGSSFHGIFQAMEVSNKKLKIELPWTPAIPLLAIYLKQPKTRMQRETHTSVFTAAFIIATIREQSRCPLTVEWIKRCGI